MPHMCLSLGISRDGTTTAFGYNAFRVIFEVHQAFDSPVSIFIMSQGRVQDDERSIAKRQVSEAGINWPSLLKEMPGNIYISHFNRWDNIEGLQLMY